MSARLRPGFAKRARDRTIVGLVTCFLIGLIGAVSAANAQQQPVEKSGWKLNCIDGGKCELGFTQSKGGRVVTRLLIYELGKQTILEYLVPLGVNLQKGIVLQIDDTRNFPTRSLYCEASGCVGYAELSPDLLIQLKRGILLKLAFSPHTSSQYFAFDYPLDKFTALYAEFLAHPNPAAPKP